MVRVRRAEHDQDFRIDLPDALDGFYAVPAGRHADIDERQRVRAAVAQGLLDQRESLLALVGRVDLESFGGLLLDGYVAEQRRRLLLDGPVVVILGSDDLAEILVDGFLVVDHQNTDRFRMAHVSTSTGVNGSSTVNSAPRPGPSLYAVSVPPSSLAAFAELCRPKPWPCLFVVNPCENTRVRFSLGYPHAGILDLDQGLRLIGACIDSNAYGQAALLRGAFQEGVLGVGHEVHEDLQQFLLLDPHLRHIGIIADHFDVVLVERGGIQAEGVVGQLGQGNRLDQPGRARVRLLHGDDGLHVVDVLGQRVQFVHDRGLIAVQVRRHQVQETGDSLSPLVLRQVSA